MQKNDQRRSFAASDAAVSDSVDPANPIRWKRIAEWSALICAANVSVCLLSGIRTIDHAPGGRFGRRSCFFRGTWTKPAGLPADLCNLVYDDRKMEGP